MLKLKNYTVKLKPLGWYDLQTIKAEMMSGAKMDGGGLTGVQGEAYLGYITKMIELSIEEIKEGDTVIAFSLEWLKGLDAEDGTKLEEAVNKQEKK